MIKGTYLNVLYGVLYQCTSEHISMCCMKFCLNEHGNLFKCVKWSSISMIKGTYLNVLYGVLYQCTSELI